MNDRLAQLLAERARRSKRLAFDLHQLCTRPQLRVATSRATRKVLKCGRRSGKTRVAAVKLLAAAREEPVVPCLYVTMTRSNAKEILWADLLALNEEYGLGGVANITELTLTFPNGGVIQLRGANNEREIAKIRGKKFKLVIIDEAQSIPDRILRPLIKDVIGPTLMDYGGELWLVGTPPPVRAGYFYESYAGSLAAKREQHHWTVVDNDRLPRRMQGVPIEQILAEIREENAWTEDDPTYQREYLGKDVEDLDALLFQIRANCHLLELPPFDDTWTTVFGVDIGHDDSDAIAVLGWPRHSKRVYLLEEHVHAKEDVTDLALRLKDLIPRWRPIRMAIDQGGLGKKIAEELRRRHGLAVTPADKAQKGAYIRLFNAACRKGEFAALATSKAVEDAKLVQKCPKALVHGELKERSRADGGYHSDVLDAVLYGWRGAIAYLEQDPPAPEPDRGEAIRRAIIERNMRQQAAEDEDPFAAALGFG